VAFDSGSGNLLLPSARCRSIGCLAHEPYEASASSTSRPVPLSGLGVHSEVPETVAVDVSTGEAEGELVLDKVCLGREGNACAEMGLVQLTRATEEPFSSFPYDGILGIGMPQASLDRRFSLLGNLVDAGVLRRNRFAVWLAGDFDEEESEVVFGDFSEDRLGSEVMWLPVSRLDTGMWQARMPDFAVGGRRAHICGSDGCEVAFDTGTSAIAMPAEMLQLLLARLRVEEDCSNYHQLPMLGFAFPTHILNIEREDYVKKVDDKCYHQFLRLEIPPPKGPLVLLGDPFLKRYFTIFDHDSLKIGLAFSNHAHLPGAANRSGAAGAARLMLTQQAHI